METTQPLNKKFDPGKLIKWGISVGVPLMLLLIPVNEAFTAQARLFLVLSIMAILIIAFDLVNMLIPSILLPTAYVVLGVVEQKVAFQGFSTPTLIEAFGDCALRAKKAGFDGVEIHGAHGYLINTFVSAFSNKRTDQYGGNLQNRARFALDIVGDIRKKVGKDYPIFYRMTSVEYVEGGLTIEDAKVLAMLLEDAGVDAIHVSQGGYDFGGAVVIPPAIVPHGYYVNNAAEIKKMVDIPVIAVGRINDALLAEEILVSGKADMVAMARASLADPELPNKVREGRHDEILHCIGCVQACKSKERGCLVNPLTGHESEYDLSRVKVEKRVFVAGGGVAGCEASIVAALRGHQVTLFEQSEMLGGQWLSAGVPIGKEEFTSFLLWQKTMLDKLGVTIRLQTPFTRALAEAEKPDSIIVATGSRPTLPPIKGIDQDFVCVASDVLLGRLMPGKRVVVIGGGLVGAETADFLAANGQQVTLVEMLSQIIQDGEPAPAMFLKERLRRNGVIVYTSARVSEIGEHTVTMIQGEMQTVLSADTVVLATGQQSHHPLFRELADYAGQILLVGDANTVKNGHQNIKEGFLVGLSI